MKSKITKLIPVVIFPALFWTLPCPDGLDINTWHMAGLCLALMCGLILKPFSEPIISLIIVGLGAFFVKDPNALFYGWGQQNVWFILAVLLACSAFRKNGLGKRMAYILLSKFGNTSFGRSSLGLGYVMLICDLILSPATGSNTSRSAIVFPIFRGLSEALDSHPDKNPRKLGAYLELLQHVVTMSTAALFLTGMASNAVIASTINNVVGIELTWALWFKAALVPGLLILFLSPIVVYKLFPPEMRDLGNIKPIVLQKIAEMGPMKRDEKVMFVLFICAILGWSIGYKIGMGLYIVAFIWLALELVFGLLNWDDLMAEKGAWNMFTWFGAFYSLTVALNDGGFYTWIASQLQLYLNLNAISGSLVLVILVLLSLVVKYFFVSNSAYIVSIYPVVLTLAKATQVNMMALSLMLVFFGAYGALLCNYGNGASIYLYGNGYVSQKDWYTKGTIILILISLVLFTVGLPYWKLIGIL
ncbi:MULTISPECIES: DASS family sodium-coupled anion symporter [Pantoea]|uniref:DASS family sodium-coupled anion symporter n=1 Tax=Pantoea anthophila TaxID=470931 RepID=A0ABY2Z8H1_9GAMM|nr:MULTISPECIES: DASS family sodium-coupled anion symporter [Pantoea]PZL84721.1 anion transporter [Pantoea sp. ARC270]TPV28329.1 DASS family sodium-coupled anion symporter [Pantoea anthophila]WIM54789.1 DASS family sodium-coupled anion symporter [Pantoea anthophila]